MIRLSSSRSVRATKASAADIRSDSSSSWSVPSPQMTVVWGKVSLMWRQRSSLISTIFTRMRIFSRMAAR